MTCNLFRFAFAAAFLLSPNVTMAGQSSPPLEVCHGGNRAERKATCIYDGDTGWYRGVKWRLLSIDAPEIQTAECKNEKRLAYASRDV
jgi:endonuclease YncB( thermonuclease family)